MSDQLYRGLRDFMEDQPQDRDDIEVRFEGEEYDSFAELEATVTEYADGGDVVYAERLDLTDQENRERIRGLPSLADGEAVLARAVDDRTMEFYGSPGDGVDQLLEEADKLENYVFQKNDAISEFFTNYDLLLTVRDGDDDMTYAATLVSEEVEYKGCAGADYVFPGEVTVLEGRVADDVEPDAIPSYLEDADPVEDNSQTLAEQVDVDPEIDEGEDLFLQQGPGSERIERVMHVDEASYDEFEETMLEVHDDLESLGAFIDSYENFLEAFSEVNDWDESFEGGEQLGETNVKRGYDESDLDFHRQTMRESLMDLALEDEASITNIRDALIFTHLGAQNALYEDPEKRQRFRKEHPEVYEGLANSGKQLSVTGISDLTATEVRPEGGFHDPTDVARVMRTMAHAEGNAVDEYLKAYEQEALREKQRRESMGNDETAERMFQ